MRIGERKALLIDTDFGKLHPFQKELMEALLDPKVGIINVEAPVGVGKTTVIRKALEFCKQPIVATFPTTILIDTQAGKISEGSKVFHWPKTQDPSAQDYDLGLIEYSSRSLSDLAIKRINEIANLKRGEMLDKLFGLTPLIAGKTILLTTPDVLWLIYRGKFAHAKRLQLSLSNSIIFFDEFHCYCDLRNFYKLLQKLWERGVHKVVLMSATPFMRQDIHLDFPGDQVDIRFEEREEPGLEQRIFNYSLNVEVLELDYHNPYRLIELLKTRLDDLPKPTALIFDSIFRLMQVEPLLKQEFPNTRFFRYDGLTKEKFVLEEGCVVLGTSSIEVGIDMDFASMVFEGSSWTTAIQRLGRVGRKRPGHALILSERSFEPYRPAQEEIPRSTFESILREYLPDPRTDWVSGELFRGDAPSFLLIDEKGRPYFYGPGIFSMYDIAEWDNYTPDRAKLQKIIVEMGADESAMAEIMTHLSLFPVVGILKAEGIRERYVPVISVEIREAECVVELDNGDSFYFQKEEADD
ncbi:MAG: type I-D CRISPR-associated helicase Cas3' [Candidatus Caldatribacteriaceae bacterium]